jgi:hypothetical protein
MPRLLVSFVDKVEQQLASRSLMAVNISTNFLIYFCVHNKTMSMKLGDLFQVFACLGNFLAMFQGSYIEIQKFCYQLFRQNNIEEGMFHYFFLIGMVKGM